MTDHFPTFRKIAKAIPTIPGRLLLFLQKVPNWLWRFTKKTAKVGAVVLIILVTVHSVVWFICSMQLNADIDEIQRRGEPVTPADLAQKSIPDSENAAVIYQKASKQLRDDGDAVNDSVYISDLINLTNYGPRDTQPKPPYPLAPSPAGPPSGTPAGTSPVYVEEDTPARREVLARQALARQSQVFELMKEAQSKPMCRFNIRWKNGTNPDSSACWPLTGLSQLAQAKAIIESKDGHTDAALASILQALKVADAMKDDPCTTGFLHRTSLINKTLLTLQSISKDRTLTVSQSQRIYQALQNPGLDEHLKRGLLEGRVCDIQSFNTVRNRPGLLAFEVLGDNYQRKPTTEKAFAYLWRPLTYKDEQVYMRLLKFLIPLTGESYSATTRKLHKSGLEQVPKYARMAEGVLPYLVVPWKDKDVTKARIGLTQTAMALKAYENKFKVYPVSITELRQKLGWNIPKDLFTGKDFVYSKKGNGFILYSFGSDLKDDHGRTYKETHGRNNDIVWRATR